MGNFPGAPWAPGREPQALFMSTCVGHFFTIFLFEMRMPESDEKLKSTLLRLGVQQQAAAESQGSVALAWLLL